MNYINMFFFRLRPFDSVRAQTKICFSYLHYVYMHTLPPCHISEHIRRKIEFHLLIICKMWWFFVVVIFVVWKNEIRISPRFFFAVFVFWTWNNIAWSANFVMFFFFFGFVGRVARWLNRDVFAENVSDTWSYARGVCGHIFAYASNVFCVHAHF